MMKRRAVRYAMLVLVLLGYAAMLFALDVDDVKNMMHNQVPEQVIVNMVQGQDIDADADELDELRALGASEALIAALCEPVYQEPVQTEAVYHEVVEPVTITETVSAMPVEGSPVTPVAIVLSGGHPPRYAKEGWLSISNRDWMPYYINIDVNRKRIFISRAPNGGLAVQSGENVVVNIRKETYKMYGDAGNELKVKVRENETTTLSLEPFGVFGNSGLSGTSVDRDNVRSAVLFANYVPVIIQEPSVIVVPSVPPPPPPHVWYGPGPRHRPPHRGGIHFRW